jgi:hypothetical protein
MPATSNFDVSVSVGDVIAGDSSTGLLGAAFTGAFTTGFFATGCPASIPAEHTITAAHRTPFPIYCLFTVAPPDAAPA